MANELCKTRYVYQVPVQITQVNLGLSDPRGLAFGPLQITLGWSALDESQMGGIVMKIRDERLLGFLISRILETVGWTDWEELPGKQARITIDFDTDKEVAIHHITDNNRGFGFTFLDEL
jgi:hypothetical protein